MKLLTHYIFSTGLLAFIGSLFSGNFGLFISAFIISVISNYIIDRFGHKIRNRFYTRTKRTHSINNSIMIGLMPAFALMFALDIYHNIIINSEIIAVFYQGFFAGPSHLFLDAFTCNGIFIKSGNKFKRFTLLHLKYNNKAVNYLFIFLGLLFIIASINL